MDADEERLFEQFVQTLQAPSPPPIPQQTLLGGISHYLSTLPSGPLAQFVESIRLSPYLWQDREWRWRTRMAVFLGIEEAVARLRDEDAEGEGRRRPGWFVGVRRRKSRMAEQKWMDDIAAILLREGDTQKAVKGKGKGTPLYDAATIHMLVTVLSVASSSWLSKGEEGMRVNWAGRNRVRVEEAVVMSLAGRLAGVGVTGGVDGMEPEKESLLLLCEVLASIQVDRLRVLNLQAILAAMRSHLLEEVAAPFSRSSPYNPVLATGISQLLPIVATDPNAAAGQLAVLGWTVSYARAMRELVSTPPEIKAKQGVKGERNRRIADVSIETAVPGADTAPENNDDWTRRKVALLVFVLPSLTALDLMIESPPLPGVSSGPSASSPAQRDAQIDVGQVAHEVLLTLSCFSDVIASTSGGVDGYQRLILGMTDILVASRGARGVRDILECMGDPSRLMPHEAAWWLAIGDNVVRWIDRQTMEARLDPLVERFITQDGETAAFRVAHALRLAVIAASGECAENGGEGRDVPSEDLDRAVSYCQLLLQQLQSRRVTQDDFRSAYPVAVQAISRLSPPHVRPTIDLLIDGANSTSDTTSRLTCYLAAISCAPHVPHHDLASLLELIARLVLDSPPGLPERQQLIGAAFKMVMADLNDAERRLGMEWWTRWRDTFESPDHHIGSRVMAKL